MAVTQCAGGGGDTRVEVRLHLLTDEDLALDYVLTDDDGVTRTGTVTLTPEDSQASEDPHATLEFTGLPVGRYHIDFLPDGGGEPVTVQNQHHEGAVTMVQDEIDDGENPDAVQLAQTIKTGQTAEIETVKRMLADF